MSSLKLVAASAEPGKVGLGLTATTSANPSLQPAPTFLALPTEIRLMIYKMLFHYSRGTYLVHGMKVEKSTQLLRVCKQIHMEAKESFDKDKKFWMVCDGLVRKG